MRLGLRAGTLATVSVLALATALPAHAENVTVSNITVAGAYAITVPTVEAENTNLTEAQIRRIFTGDFANNAEALADLDATAIRIPEISVTYAVPAASGTPGESATIIYRDIEILGVADGVATSASVGGSSIDAGSDVTMEFGRMATGTFDIGALLAFYGMGAPDPTGAFKTLYADFGFDGGTIKAPGFACDFAAARLERFEARPLRVDFAEFAELTTGMDPDETPSPEVIRKIIDFYVDILTAFRSTPMAMDGFTCSGSDDDATISASGGVFDVGGFEPGKYPYFGVNDIKVDVTGPTAGSFSLGNFTWKQMDFSGPIEALQSAPVELNEAWFEANWRKLVPALDGLSLRDLAIDAPNPDDSRKRVKGSVGAFDVSLADYVNGIPSRIGLTTENFIFEVPSDDDEGRMLRALGFETIDFSQDLQLHWNEADQTIVIDAISIDAADLGTIKVSGILGNATPQLFAENNSIATVAAMALTAKELTIDIDDRGLSSLIIGVAAAEEGQEPAGMRVGFGALAQTMVFGLLGTTPEAIAASEEVAAFVRSKPKLSLTLKAKTDAGLPLPLLMMASENPTILAGQLTVSALASGDDRPADQPLQIETPATEPQSGGDGARPDDGTQSESQLGKGALKN